MRQDSSTIGDKHKKYAAKQTKAFPQDGHQYTQATCIDTQENCLCKNASAGIIASIQWSANGKKHNFFQNFFSKLRVRVGGRAVGCVRAFGGQERHSYIVGAIISYYGCGAVGRAS